MNSRMTLKLHWFSLLQTKYVSVWNSDGIVYRVTSTLGSLYPYSPWVHVSAIANKCFFKINKGEIRCSSDCKCILWVKRWWCGFWRHWFKHRRITQLNVIQIGPRFDMTLSLDLSKISKRRVWSICEVVNSGRGVIRCFWLTGKNSFLRGRTIKAVDTTATVS